MIRRHNIRRGPKPIVEFEDRCYSARSYKVEIPDLAAMKRIDALLWLCQNTYPTGYSRPNPLAGFGGAISVASR